MHQLFTAQWCLAFHLLNIRNELVERRAEKHPTNFSKRSLKSRELGVEDVVQTDMRFTKDAVGKCDIFPTRTDAIIAVLNTCYIEGIFFTCLGGDFVDPVV